MIDLERREKEILRGLKDFQRDTVERVFSLFEKGQYRVLVADEVGLGKTLIAKGVIAKTALLHKRQGDDLFKVVYICSNQNIARQNIMKLKIDTEVTVDDTSDTRLSMQHLKFHEQKNDEKIINNYVQLIPLTPATAFTMVGGSGIVQERALIFAILKRVGWLSSYENQLEKILRNSATSWENWAKNWMEQRVVSCNEKSNGKYLEDIIAKVEKALDSNYKELKEELSNILEDMKNGGEGPNTYYYIIHKLRGMMAQISIDFLEPDLVIMDEFQRFRELINSDENSEVGILTRSFLQSNKVKTLLLSATPYKLYSTLEEITEAGGDEHYNEFMEVIDFIFDKDEVKRKEFRLTWKEFSDSLKQLDLENWSKVSDKKQAAENQLFEGICRTERLSVSESGNAMLNTEKAREAIEINEKDIISYIESDIITEELQKLGSKAIPPIEYIKSSPYIFSFMEHYQLKRELKNYIKKSPELAKLVGKNSQCWLRRDIINRYEKLPATNARLEILMKEALANNAELLMWIPPSLPYYDMSGAYKNSSKFSKLLVFSAWEMVPRMIASLISYESERKTVGRLLEKEQRKSGDGKSYFAESKRRYPRGRLNLGMRKNEKTGKIEPARMSLFSLMYPSLTLAKLFNPTELLNSSENRITRAAIERILNNRLKSLLEGVVDKYQKINTGAQDERWYWAAPLILDVINYKSVYSSWLNEPVKNKIDNNEQNDGYEEVDGKEENTLFSEHLFTLKNSFFDPEGLKLGPIPDDLQEVLVLQTLGSPAICALRMFMQDAKGDYTYMFGLDGALKISKGFIKKFNTPEATAIVEISYGSDFSRKKVKEPDEVHWINVLKYGADGNLQAVLDEYRHMLVESYGLKDMAPEARIKEVSKLITDSMKTHTASYKVDTYNSFIADGKRSEMRIRSHFAAGFYNSGKEGKAVQRTESLRQSFNSPFRPFVLATTSIGQEGLDFHVYCRKIVHWNLPSNPTDLEQREGRINRFKGLAIRQNVAQKYGNIKFSKDIWEEMFLACKEAEKGEHCELVPYWYMEPDNSEAAVQIERIVPMYPLSRDCAQYERLIKILSLYRVTLGQARQEELIIYILNNVPEEQRQNIKDLFINLSPYYKKRKVENRGIDQDDAAVELAASEEIVASEKSGN